MLDEPIALSHPPLNQNPLYSSAFEQLPKAACIVNWQGVILALNKVGRKMLIDRFRNDRQSIQESEEFLPAKLGDVFCGDQEQLCERISAAANGEKLLLKLRSDTTIQLHFIASSLGHDSKQLEQFLLTLDEAEPASEPTAAFQQEFDELKTSFALLQEFNSVAVHDIKAPLRNITSLMTFIQEDHGDKLPIDGQRSLARARNAATRLSALVSSLLDHAKSGSAKIEKNSLNLAELFDDIFDSLDSILKADDAKIIIENPLGSVDGDSLLVRQLLENIVNNAIKYQSQDRALKLEIIRHDAGLTIQDNGIGFENQYQNQIFEPFRRLHSAADIEGSGLGLAICRDICLRHNWTLNAEGQPGHGSRFTIGFCGDA